MSQDLSSISHLSAERWQQARQRAIETIRSGLPEPRPEHYISSARISKYPLALVNSIIVMLIIVGLAAFWISAGKQIAAAGLVVDPISASSDRLSPTWGTGGVVAMLAFGEVGSILFLVTASVFDMRRRLFTVFAVGSASISVIANVSITATHDLGSVTVFGWFITFMAPITVLAVGAVVEQLIMTSLAARADQQAQYGVALAEYQKAQIDPETQASFKAAWAKAIYDELCRYKKDRDTIETLSSEDQFELLNREYHVHMRWERYEVSTPQAVSQVSLSQSSHETVVETPETPVETATKDTSRSMIIAQLQLHPELADVSVRQLASQMGVSPATAGRALFEFKQQNPK